MAGVSNDNYFNATRYKLVSLLKLFPLGDYHCHSSRFYCFVYGKP